MLNFLKSTIGRKYIMGLTGLVWSGFVLAHMAGNMLLFVSKDMYNSYGHALTSGNIIYAAEAVLIAALLAHIFCAISLVITNSAARPQNYAVKPKSLKAGSLASRYMAIEGSVVLVFIILHIATFKYGTYYETTVNGVAMRDLSRLVIEVFQSPGYVFWYVFSLIVLSLHLRHGVSSVFQSFGLLNESYQPTIKKIGWAYSSIVVAGFISQPLYAFLGQ